MANNKKLAKKDDLDEKRYTNVLLESMDSKIDAVLEDRKTLNEKINRHYGEFQEFRKEVDYKFEVVFKKFDEITDEIHLIHNDSKEKVSRDEFIVLEKKVLILEKAQ